MGNYCYRAAGVWAVFRNCITAWPGATLPPSQNPCAEILKGQNMKQDRFLVGILVGIALLVVLALVTFFMRKDTAMSYGTDDTPEGVVHNYAVAVYKRDYPKAYSYLADLKDKPDLEQFRQSFLMNQVYPENAGLDIGATEMVSDTEAIVSINIVYSPSDPFSSGYRTTEQAFLVKQDGNWKIRQMPYNFWSYDWYQPTPQPIK